MGLGLSKNSEDPDSAWKQQNKEQQENQMYKLVNLQKMGLLIQVFEDEGPEALQMFIRQHVEPVLYNGGKGEMVRKVDYVRWKKKGEAKRKGLPIEVEEKKPDHEIMIDFQEDDFNKFEEHVACWNLDHRGAMGETPLHLLCLHNTFITISIAKVLLSMYPKLSMDFYESDEYYGESALHFMIMHGDFEMVKLLVENGANVNQRATGRFFMPEDQKKGRHGISNFEGFAYYGEYPLAFASSFGHEEIYDYLIDHGADPNLTDSFGNTVLHMMVISNQIGMFGYAVKHHSKKANMEIHNDAKLTPLTLASKLGRNEIFKEIIELQSLEIWRYSNITCSMYPIAPLDTIGPGGKTNWSSALIYITDGDSEDHLQMLEGGVIKQLLDEKWKTFARGRFYQQFAAAMVYLATLSTAIYMRTGTVMLTGTDSFSVVRYTAEVLVLLYCLINIIFQVAEIFSQGLFSFLKNQASAPAKCIFNISCILILLCLPARLLRYNDAEMVLLAIAAPGAWCYLLFFARGLGPLGPFVIMIYKMLASDLVRFVIIFIIFLIVFSQAFFFLFKDIDDSSITTFKTAMGTAMELIQMTFGEFKYDVFDQTRQPTLTKFVFGLFAILVPILLLNMLIAMMGNTYQQVISRSEKEWKRQWAKIIIVLERSYSKSDLLKFQEDYAMKIGGPDSDARGLLVIKTSKKTKARQRKGAIANWKKLVKEIKLLIKDAKREGKTGILDLSSSDMSEKLSERQMHKRRSNINKTRQRNLLDVEDDYDFDDAASADGLIAAMSQLAWEKDIDLTKGKVFSQTPRMKEVEEEEPSTSQSGSATKQRVSELTPVHVDNQNLNNNNDGGENAPPPPQGGATGDLPLKEVKPAENRNSSGGRKRTSKVSPELPALDPLLAKEDRTQVPPSGGSRPSSAAKREDSARKKQVFTISGSKKESSASSLTSLLGAFDEANRDRRDESTDV